MQRTDLLSLDGLSLSSYKEKRDQNMSKIIRFYTLSEAVLEAAGHILEVSHTAGTSGLASKGLLAPVVYMKSVSKPGNKRDTSTHLGGRVGAGSTSLLLLVERAVSTASAEGVALGVLLTKAGGTFGLKTVIR